MTLVAGCYGQWLPNISVLRTFVTQLKTCGTPYIGINGVQRSGDTRGDCLLGCPLPNSSIEQWHMVVIVTGYTLFVTSQYDVIFTFAN